MKFIVVVCLLGVAPAAFAQDTEQAPATGVEDASTPSQAIPWVSHLHWGVGGDSNINLSQFGSKLAPLSSVDLVGQVQPTKRLRISGQVSYDKNLPSALPGTGGGELFVGYMRALPGDLQLRVSGQLGLRRDRSVFADGLILENTSALQSNFEGRMAALLAYRIGPFDIEGGTQINTEAQRSNAVNANLRGINLIGGLRYTLRDRVALRARYSYEFTDTRGLSARNLAGGLDLVVRPLLMAVNRFRISARTRVGSKSSVFVRYDYVNSSDDYSGHLDSHEHVAFLASSFDYETLSLDANAELATRDFYRRTASVDNNGSDTTVSGGLRADAWILPTPAGTSRLGVFAHYRLEVVSASPTGLIFARHIAVVGVAAKFGKDD